MTTHHLKTWLEPFHAIVRAEKTCEVRHEQDRTFDVGDLLVLIEVDFNSHPTGRRCKVIVSHVIRAAGSLVLGLVQAGTRELSSAVAMSIRLLDVWEER